MPSRPERNHASALQGALRLEAGILVGWAKKTPSGARAHRGRKTVVFSLFLVAVVFGFIGAFGGDAEVFRLFGSQLGEDDSDFFQVEACDFLVEFFRQATDGVFVFSFVRPEVDLGERLVGEGV